MKLKWVNVNLAIIVGSIVILAAMCGFLHPDWYPHFWEIPILDSGYRVIAQALITEPLPTPEFIHVSPDPGSVLRRSDSIYVSFPDLHFENREEIAAASVEIYVNGHRLNRYDYIIYGTGGNMGPDSYVFPQFAFAGNFMSGLHLMEIRFTTPVDSAPDQTVQTVYTWAYEVR